MCLRGYKAAAPLKPDFRGAESAAFRGLRGYKAAAPLKLGDSASRKKDKLNVSAATKPRPH